MSEQNNDGCLNRSASKQPVVKTAAGISVFLMEELGDARLRCAQLKKYIDEASSLIEKSTHRDHFFEVAGHLIHGIPECLLKMEKALDASALAAARLDYEEIKDNLRPEKVEELEKALEEVRIRHVQRRSAEPEASQEKPQEAPAESDQTQKTASVTARKEETPMNTKVAAAHLESIAKKVEATGRIPIGHVLHLIALLEKGHDKTASTVDPKMMAGHFRGIAKQLVAPTADGKPHSRLSLARHLRSLYANEMQPTSAQMAAAIYQQANSREEVMKGFKEANPAMSDADLEKAADMWEKHKDVVKEKQ